MMHRCLYGMPARSVNLLADPNHLERIQRLAAKWVTGLRHGPYRRSLQRLGLRSWQRRRVRADLVIAFKIFTDLLDVAPIFCSSHSWLPKTTPLPGPPRSEPSPEETIDHFGEGSKILVEVSDFNIFKKRLDQAWTDIFPYLLVWHRFRLNTHLLNSLSHPLHIRSTHWRLSLLAVI